MSERTTPSARASLALLLAASVAFLLSVLLDLAPWLRGPAPYPPEWQWEQRSPLAAPPLTALVAVALTLGLLAASGTPWARRHPTRLLRVALAAAIAVGFALPLALLGREPGGALRTLVARTTSASVTSYHAVAVSPDAQDPLSFVRRHAELLPGLAATAKHAATHPPGPVLLFRASVSACERSPALSEALLRLAGFPERPFAPPLTRPARAGALLGSLVLNLLAALAAWPLAALARGLGLTPAGAARAALMWTVLPGPVLVAPRFDASLALPVVGFAALLLAATRGSSRAATRGGSRAMRGFRACTARTVLAGGCAAVALQLSYGAAAFLLIAGGAVVAAAAVRRAQEGEGARGAFVPPLALGALAGSVAVALAFGAPALLGASPWRGLAQALQIHRETYTTPRDYLLWLAFDPVDFAVLLGFPLALVTVAALPPAARALRARSISAPQAFLLAAAAGVALLVLSGTTRGEVGRLWIPLMPLLLPGTVASLGEDARPGLLVGLLVALSTLAIAAAWRL